MNNPGFFNGVQTAERVPTMTPADPSLAAIHASSLSDFDKDECNTTICELICLVILVISCGVRAISGTINRTCWP